MTKLEEAERAISIGAEHPNAMILGEHCRLVRDELARLRAEVEDLRGEERRTVYIADNSAEDAIEAVLDGFASASRDKAIYETDDIYIEGAELYECIVSARKAR